VESPWFDLDCVISKHATRLLERQFLRDPSNKEKIDLWRSKTKTQRRLFQHKRSSYLRRSIEDAKGDGLILWRSLHSLLDPPADTTSAIIPWRPPRLLHSQDRHKPHCNKGCPTANPHSHSNPTGFNAFLAVLPEQVNKLIKDSSSKRFYAHLAPQIPSFCLCAYSFLIN